jgi:hypothetical protein
MPDLFFQEPAKQYIATHRSKWRSAKHAHEWEMTLLRYAYPRLGLKRCQDIGVNDVLEVLRPIWH